MTNDMSEEDDLTSSNSQLLDNDEMKWNDIDNNIINLFKNKNTLVVKE